MTIGVYTFEIHLPGAQSLKDKRQIVRRVKDRLRSKFNVAVVETPDLADLWQRSGIVVVSVASQRDALERLFEAVHREASTHVPGSLIETGLEYLDGVDDFAG